MAERRRYTRKTKAEVVGMAEVIGIRPAARRAHVPESSLRRWRESPEMAQLRAEKRVDVAADMWAGVQIGMHRIIELLPQTDDVQKVAVATGVIFDKLQMMTGEATSRVETKSLTAERTDEELEALTTSIDSWLEARRAEVVDVDPA